MTLKDSKAILWENISALMIERYGKENLGRAAKESGVGAATMTRIKEQKTSVGTDHIDRIAKALKVEPWQLISPKGSQAPPTHVSPFLRYIDKSTPPEILAVLELLEAIPRKSLSEAAWSASRALIPFLPRAASSPATTEPVRDATRENTSS